MPINFKFKKVSGRKQTASRTARTATKRKKSALKRRSSYHTKKRKWWKKYKKSARYKNGRLLKYTTKCNLAELVEWMYPNIGKLIEAMAYNPKSSNVTGAGNMFLDAPVVAANLFLRAVTQCMDDRSVFNQGDDSDTHASKKEFWFAAFNPIIDRSQAGPLFNTYMNLYKWMKFVGLRVKWVPNSKYSDFFAFNRTINGAIDTARMGNGVPANAAGISSEQQVQFFSGPKVYMNVLFKKDCYISPAVPIQSINAAWSDPVSIPLDTGYRPPANKYIDYPVIKIYKAYDDVDATFIPPYKKYDLSKRFKFYVRPYEHSLKYEIGSNPVYSSISLGVMASSAGYYNSIYGGLDSRYYNKNVHETRPVKATWKATEPNIPSWLKSAPNYLVDAEGVCKAQAWVNAALDDCNYYNPTLFGFNFTFDSKERNKSMNLVTYATNPPGEITNIGTLISNVYTNDSFGMQQLGNFYFTVYYRFKGRRANQHLLNSEYIPAPNYGTLSDPAWYTAPD